MRPERSIPPGKIRGGTSISHVSGLRRATTAGVLAQINFGAIEGLLTQWLLEPATMDLAHASKQLIDMVERQVAG